MQEFIETALIALGAVIIMTTIYRLAPFRELDSVKPKLAFFPKYAAQYAISTEEVILNLKELGFEPHQQESNIYSRGKTYGDFSAKFVKLRVEINDQAKQLKVYAPFMGVFFDSGDLWTVAYDAIHISDSK